MKLHKSTLITLVASLSIACGGMDAQTSDEANIISQDGKTQLIPGLDGGARSVETLSFSVQSGSAQWTVRVDGVKYQILAEGGGGDQRVSVSQSGAVLFSFQETNGALTVEGAGEDGVFGAVYPSAALTDATQPLTQQHIQGLRAFAQTVVPVADALAVSLATIGLAEYLDHVIEGGEADTQALGFLAGVFNFIKKVGKFLGGLLGGGQGSGLDCPGGSTASCQTAEGNNSVTCSNCGANCTVIYGAAGTSCTCGCL